MARSLIRGLQASGWPQHAIQVSDPDPGSRQRLEQMFNIKTSEHNGDVVSSADIVVFAVKPQILPDVARELSSIIQQSRPLVISIAAGIRTDTLQQWLGEDVTLIRAMPNTPALIGSGATGLYAGPQVDSNLRDMAESILRAVGVVVWVENEDLMDVITALSGSGPAYFLLVMEALETAAIKQGLDPAIARLLIMETAFGATKMALEDGDEPARLRERVTSPGGTTEQAVKSLEKDQIRDIFERALNAATARSRELAELLGKN